MKTNQQEYKKKCEKYRVDMEIQLKEGTAALTRRTLRKQKREEREYMELEKEEAEQYLKDKKFKQKNTVEYEEMTLDSFNEICEYTGKQNIEEIIEASKKIPDNTKDAQYTNTWTNRELNLTKKLTFSIHAYTPRIRKGFMHNSYNSYINVVL